MNKNIGEIISKIKTIDRYEISKVRGTQKRLKTLQELKMSNNRFNTDRQISRYSLAREIVSYISSKYVCSLEIKKEFKISDYQVRSYMKNFVKGVYLNKGEHYFEKKIGKYKYYKIDIRR